MNIFFIRIPLMVFCFYSSSCLDNDSSSVKKREISGKYAVTLEGVVGFRLELLEDSTFSIWEWQDIGGSWSEARGTYSQKEHIVELQFEEQDEWFGNWAADLDTLHHKKKGSYDFLLPHFKLEEIEPYFDLSIAEVERFLIIKSEKGGNAGWGAFLKVEELVF